MKINLIFILVLVASLTNSLARSEPLETIDEESEETVAEEAPMLKPRYERARPAPTLKPKFTVKKQVPPPLTHWDLTSVVLLAYTPLGYETTLERRFSTYGVSILGDWPLARLDPLFLRLQAGLNVGFSSLTLTQPNLEFLHFTLDVPFLLRVLFPLGPTSPVAFEIFGGVVVRPMDFDTRTTADGGLGFFRANPWILFDAGAGLSFRFSPSAIGRIRGSYQYLAVGLEFPF